METETEVATRLAELRAAWDSMIEELQSARDAIDSEEYFPPRASDRNLAEGYRYLGGFLHHAIERSFHEDPDFPAFRNALSLFNKSTIDNSDAIYFYAPIDGRKYYRITAELPDHCHWRDQPRAATGPLAPQYLIFEVTGGPIAGDTGDLSELRPGARIGFGTLDSSALKVDAGASLELLLGPERPDDYQGNFICTRKPPASNDVAGSDRFATYVSGRQLFYDWDREQALHLDIVCVENEGLQPQPPKAERVAQQLRHLGSIVRGQMHFWLAFYDRVLDCNGRHPQGGRYAMPVNSYNRPNAASGDTGGGMSTNIYAGGIFDLAEDEALYIEASYTGDPVYTSLHLGNLWGESLDYANHQSSLNGFQMHMSEDGLQRWVIAHRDPGVPNWLDTTGLNRGFMSNRWAYSSLPSEEHWPKIRARKIRFDEILECFPEATPVVNPQQRRAVIAMRQRHVRRRYRVF